MIFVGERINTGFKDIKQAVLERDPKPLREWAIRQTEAGADYLDVNLGAVSTKAEDMCWMVETVQAAVDTPISIDTNKVAILAEAIRLCDKPPLINSTTGAEEKSEQFFSIAVEYDASIIGLAMDESGSPQNADMRVEKAGMLLAKAMEYGIPMERLYLDPILMPLKYRQEQASDFLDAVRQFQMFSDPPPHVICGLSNVSSGTIYRKLINRTFLVMAVANGMDAVICDVMDTDLINAARSAELIMNKAIYADSYTRT